MSQQHDEPERQSALAIVAHPDDETIWCGGLILRYSNWDWTIFSLCRADDGDRCPKFRRVCEHLQAQAIISDLDDGCPLEVINPQKEIGWRIRRHVCDKQWDMCITHGENGEYGHERHKQAHAQVKRLVQEDTLRCDELWTFAYACDVHNARCTARRDADVRLELSPEELAEKKRIIQRMYGYAGDSFEARVCVSPEGFRRLQSTKGVLR